MDDYLSYVGDTSRVLCVSPPGHVIFGLDCRAEDYASEIFLCLAFWLII